MNAAGQTLGVEEEYHLVDPATTALISSGELAVPTDSRLRTEMLTSQLEAATDVCTDLGQLRAEILAMRSDAAGVAREHGAALLGTSTHPGASLGDVRVAPRARYDVLRERYGGVLDQFNLCGCHVHVAVPDLDTAITVMDRARRYLPVFAALTGSSPFHEAVDTGWASMRLGRLAMWPQGGIPPYLGSAGAYRDLVDRLTDAGLVDEPSELLWELRPSSRYPTVEFRIADMCPDVDDVVLYAGLVRSLVRTVAADSSPVPVVSDALLVAGRWRAARFGLTGPLWSMRQQALAPAAVVVEELWQELLPDLQRHGEDGELALLLRQLLARGTSATRQRRVFAETGSLAEVVRDGVRLTAGLPTPAVSGDRSA